ncbi:hypothetical protein LSCM1_08112 [Leishmania martiniquensis]|uniref:Uncharacterized protein n=1 Tax=Leishmania martiniquensis TaxID=1580590 RepID=A0A836KUQ8_9TRYP|nr:hypothetical protein LSCM1_08112 [Leishmania martiniquensis]
MTSRTSLSARCSAALWRRGVLCGSSENIGLPAGPPSASAPPLLLTDASIHFTRRTIEPSPLYAPRRHYGTGGTASISGGGLSLADLAKAFQQLSSDQEGGSPRYQGGQSGGGDAAAPTAAAVSPFGSPQMARRGGDGAPRGRSEPASQERSVGSADASSGSTSTSRCTPPHLGERPRTAVAHQPLIRLSPLYAERLATLTEAQLCTELERRLSKCDYNSMMQCLHELVRRLSPASTVYAPSDATANGGRSNAHGAKGHHCVARQGEADAEDTATSAARGLMENHRLLTAALSTLSRMDLYVMETETDSSPQHASAATTAGVGAAPTATLRAERRPPWQQQQQRHIGAPSPPEAPFSARLCRLLLQWLAREVSCMGPTVSLQVLHLLAQQRLFHAEAVLETLVDSISVHLERCGAAAATATRTEPNGHAFTLEEHSLLFDAMARFQAQLMRLAYLQQSTERGRHVADPSATEAGDDVSVETDNTEATYDGTESSMASAAAAVRRRALDTSSHPVANPRLFHRLAEALSAALMSSERGPPAGSTDGAAADPTGPADASAHVLRMSAVGFLFLTRALSKLYWWHDGLAAALAAPLTGYVRAHPESALVVVRLVGRCENRSGDAALLEVLQDSMITLLRRRRSALRAGAKVAQAPRRGRAAGMDDDDDVNGSGGRLVLRGDLRAGDRATGEWPYRPAETAASDANGAVAPAWVGVDDGHDQRAWDGGEEGASEVGEEAGMRLFSSTTPETHCRPRELTVPVDSTVASTPWVAASTQHHAFPAMSPERPAPDSVATLTLIDLHALPGTIEALCRFHVRTIAAVPPSGEAGPRGGTTRDEVRARLVRRMQELLNLVLDDTSRGLTSVDAIARGLSPVLLSQILLTLLEATAQLQRAWGTRGPGTSSVHRGEQTCTATVNTPHHPLVIELAYAWIVQVMRSRRPPLPPPTSHTEHIAAAASAAAAARYHRIAASAYWRRAVAVHEALLKAGLLCYTRPFVAHASDPSTTPRGKYYMPDDVLRAAPRVNAAVQRAKMQIEAERQREADERVKAEAQEREQHAAAPRYTSASVRALAQRQRSSAPSPHHRRCPTVVQPARTSDVFAGYTRALSRLI